MSSEKKKAEYGTGSFVVATNAEYIKQELAKFRTAKSLWEELAIKRGINLSYRSFLTQISSLITKNNTIRAFKKKALDNSLNTQEINLTSSKKHNTTDADTSFKDIKTFQNKDIY